MELEEKKILNRLKRTEGQIRGIQKMIDEEKECIDIITQLSAVRSSIHACNNAMRANQITKDQLPENVVVVPAGVLDLIELQAQGYAYIKP